ncbi:bifunctional diaminohydroxyphosphoribosylaminopyrimidine deaminase/5-amino-6-(5-phosphoribosylamino)uracil reductase RibD [Pseudidiomarina terrestris]|uniref:bifunctional diaminohydroxyphosphoribosylaminopyrimidine deaminase/5-amino-6-(5-phosphoribosylamino)uracil reductase RibD n=1 Tax=Pseudidiomarina terrestris TaxID=2820060 RepID=UPI00264CF8B9|nr:MULTISPECIES: bifunctional diaminohydroxyphosphoribosylaminopyrimidine deaminase/5-amino-6-(5-phosphoribosylamino)uracil reductase RibD [unclassified Pseudidiomarina]MDN7127789.1 bifunctional diaminohydroxyphosphoribosylaminopyrimidine deaminase/5-amino-6-(5-phosphoribosylamino)uracil reductase RibD [Pseudidiomarina sp. 1APR75-33.1]MDN7134841.1 bifunctional diaminohydroxyphosphoribosylaminopyrimidine deaminase/5-amino-6-(5-phosphoribosylamino)uracil reductase RibD [Pseudidiomarina sp. 1ASP75-5
MQQNDAQYMQQALELAQRGAFSVAPNPLVGCVVVRAGEVVGQGWHERPGEPHAEVYALREAGELTRGATAYVTLEPCSHHGRTPPCADALIAAGLARVVIAMQDPNPLVAGQGIQRLREAGIEVTSGVLEAAARQLNCGFVSRMERQRPWLRLKMAMSLDGRTALANGQSQWITGPEARLDVHAYRAQAGAILTSARTVMMDQARMTARHPKAERQPLRVVLDRQQQLPAEHEFFAIPDPVLRVVDGESDDQVWPAHVSTLVLPANTGRLPLRALFSQLAELEINDVWTECGAELAGALVAAELVDEWIIYVAPKLLGDTSRGVLQLPQLQDLAQAPQLRYHSFTQVGDDLKICARPLHGSAGADRGEVQS